MSRQLLLPGILFDLRPRIWHMSLSESRGCVSTKMRVRTGAIRLGKWVWVFVPMRDGQVADSIEARVPPGQAGAAVNRLLA